MTASFDYTRKLTNCAKSDLILNGNGPVHALREFFFQQFKARSDLKEQL